MANFGVSIGDIILVSSYAKGVYRSCKHAGEDFRTITSDVKSLQSHLDALNDELEKSESSIKKQGPARLKEIEELLQGCRRDLKELEQVLSRYKSLRTTDPKTRDRVRFTSRKQAEIRAKITGHSTKLQQMLTRVNTITLTRIESNTEHQVLSLAQLKAKLDEIHQDVLAGKRDPSILTDMQDWNEVEEEILYESVTEADLDVRSVIDDWLEHVRPDNDIEKLVCSIASQETLSTVSSDISRKSRGVRSIIPTENRPAVLEDEPRCVTTIIPKVNRPVVLADEILPFSSNEKDEEPALLASNIVEKGWTFKIVGHSYWRIRSRHEPHRSPLRKREKPSYHFPPHDDLRAWRQFYGLEYSDLTEVPRRRRPFGPEYSDLTEVPRRPPRTLTSYDITRKYNADTRQWETVRRNERVPPPLKLRYSDDDIPREIIIYVSLEEIFVGAKVYHRIQKRQFSLQRGNYVESQHLYVPIPMGAKRGYSMRYVGLGNSYSTHTQDVVFILEEDEHTEFQRTGDNLSCDMDITLCEALCGWKRQIDLLNGEIVEICKHTVTAWNDSICIPGLGMPNIDRPTEMGDLVIGIKVESPKTLSEAQKALVCKAFSTPEDLTSG